MPLLEIEVWVFTKTVFSWHSLWLFTLRLSRLVWRQVIPALVLLIIHTILINLVHDLMSVVMCWRVWHVVANVLLSFFRPLFLSKTEMMTVHWLIHVLNAHTRHLGDSIVARLPSCIFVSLHLARHKLSLNVLLHALTIDVRVVYRLRHVSRTAGHMLLSIHRQLLLLLLGLHSCFF